MKASKDNFSKQAGAYAKYRPGYPEALFEHVLLHTAERKSMLDCATGNGQAAMTLSSHFDQVAAIDISAAQLALAKQAPNIKYQESRAESTPFADSSFDLITVAQAFHWFDHDAFFREVKRIGKPGSLLAVWGYGNGRISNDIDQHVDHFYHVTTGPYWDSERKYVDDSYESIPFGIEELAPQRYEMDLPLTLDQFVGYLSSWSGVQHMIRAGETDPIPHLRERLVSLWPTGETKVYRIPFFLRLGRL